MSVTSTMKGKFIASNKSTKYSDILLLLTCEEFLHAPTRIYCQNLSSKFHHLLTYPQTPF